MKKELEHFYIGNSYGGNQEWFRTFMMRLGGCGAENACDSSLYFALWRGIEKAYPFDLEKLNRKDYVEFAHMMEKYLWPRMTGIDRLEIFTEGYGKYLRDRGITEISMSTLDGRESYEAAADAVKHQIDAGYPVPILILNHRDRRLSDYNWHGFLINGYELPDPADPESRGMRVKAVTYSSYEWLDFANLWNTGYVRRGGLVLFSQDQAEKIE